MAGIQWTDEEIKLGRQLLAAKAKDSEFRSRLGRSKVAAQTRILYNATSVERYLLTELYPRPVVPDELLEDRDRRAAAPLSLTAWLCGDPPSGYSALDRRQREARS
jgi:hypothetical protein